MYLPSHTEIPGVYQPWYAIGFFHWTAQLGDVLLLYPLNLKAAKKSAKKLKSITSPVILLMPLVSVLKVM